MLAAEFLGLAPWIAVAAIAIVFVGSVLQASIGVGLGLLAAPTLDAHRPRLHPGRAHRVRAAADDRDDAARARPTSTGSIFRAVVGRFAGVVVGAWLVASTGQRSIAIVVGLSVLLAVGASLTGLHFDTVPPQPADRRHRIGVLGHRRRCRRATDGADLSARRSAHPAINTGRVQHDRLDVHDPEPRDRRRHPAPRAPARTDVDPRRGRPACGSAGSRSAASRRNGSGRWCCWPAPVRRRSCSSRQLL